MQRETGKWYSDLCTANNLIYNQRCSHWQRIAEAATAVHCNYCVHMTLFAVLYFMADGGNLLFLFWVVHILSSFNSHLCQLGKWPAGLRLSFLLPEYDILSSEQPLDISNRWITYHFNSHCFTSDYPWFCQLLSAKYICMCSSIKVYVEM